jgi:hypothetical protein
LSHLSDASPQLKEPSAMTARKVIAAPRKPVAPGVTDLVPVKVPYDRRIRKDWSDDGFDGRNLAREISDCFSRPELLDDRDERFLL